MTSSLPSFLEEGIKLISFCPLCQAKQNAMEANILKETVESHLVHLRCRQCQAAILALVRVTPMGLTSVGMMTDLSVADVHKFEEAEPIEFDEIIDWHLLLKNSSELPQALSEN